MRYVLEGSVRKSSNRVRITGQLVDATTGAHLWANRFDGALDDVFDLQDSITASVAGAIEPQLQRAEIERAQRKSTQDLGAYDYFLRGMAIFHLGDGPRMSDAQALFAQAHALDPGYGAAYAMAARCISFRKSTMILEPSSPELAEAVRLARLGAANGADDAIALAGAGAVLIYVGMDLEAGALLIERACTLNPNSALAWSRAGFAKIYLGDHSTAIANFERALRLSPVDPGRYNFLFGKAYALCLAGRHDDAVAFAERVLSERPDLVPALEVRTVAYAAAGRMDEARRSGRDLIRVAPQYRVSTVAAWMGPHRPEDLELLLESLRRAGLPE